ncbi:hypothetical protein BGZ59_004383 [Podila verticillata]|nr:hypothetical protein BGZ59_004383 [Podila verticillata]KAI9232067.1 MAG: Mss4 protein-domain-containing protein [Podila humilis]KFH67965.1 hypothetical protein MVEG_06696 [Podila verticillata NRRL 6337]
MARNPGKAYTEFQGEEQDVFTTARADGTKVNKFDIYCPQESCRCKMLLASAATLVQREKSKLTLSNLPIGATVSTIEDSPENKTDEEKKAEASPPTTENTTTGELQTFWRVGDMMAFENIGFSKMLPNGIQFLSCADCDTGPLGYHESKVPQASKEYLIALNRVRYHDRS